MDDITTSAGRNFLRVVSGYGGIVTPKDVARQLGVSVQLVTRMAADLSGAGFLTVKRLPKMTYYEVTGSGRSYLEENKVTYLLVEVDDRLAEDVAASLGSCNGVLGVTDHGTGCCCKNCPREGNHG